MASVNEIGIGAVIAIAVASAIGFLPADKTDCDGDCDPDADTDCRLLPRDLASEPGESRHSCDVIGYMYPSAFASRRSFMPGRDPSLGSA